MEKLTCQSCGASAFTDQGAYRICQYCGAQYVVNPRRRSAVNTGPAPRSGVSLDSDVERLLIKCREDPRRAARYANLILDMDPTNEEALKYL